MIKKSPTLKRLLPLVLAGTLLAACGTGSAAEDDAAPNPATADEQAPGEPGADDNSVLRASFAAFPETWAPGSQSMEPAYMRVPYETLVVREFDGTISPNLATEWEFGDGAKSLTLTLRDDVTFHDGTPFNADAVKANLEFVRDEVGGQFGGPLKAGVESVDVDDEFTVTFNFTRPYGTFLDLLSQRNLPIASPAAIEDGSIATHPVGTGPWAFDPAESVEGTSAFFGKFADYWGEAPGFANIELYAIADNTSAVAAVLSGDMDVVNIDEDEFPRAESAGNVEIFSSPAIRNNINFFDRAPDGIFGDENVRRALCLAMDASVVAELSGGKGSAHPQHFIEGEAGYNPDITGWQANLEEAKKLFADAGNPTITAEIPANPFNKQEIAVRAEQMNQLPGVTITVQELTMPQWLSTWNSGQYPLGLGNNPQITPADWYGAWFAETAPANPAEYVSDELKNAADAAQGAGGGPEAAQKWQDVMAQIADEALVCSHYVNEKALVYNTDTVADAKPGIFAWEQNLIDYHAIKPAN